MNKGSCGSSIDFVFYPFFLISLDNVCRVCQDLSRLIHDDGSALVSTLPSIPHTIAVRHDRGGQDDFLCRMYVLTKGT